MGCDQLASASAAVARAAVARIERLKQRNRQQNNTVAVAQPEGAI
jgi:hypothetical protein